MRNEPSFVNGLRNAATLLIFVAALASSRAWAATGCTAQAIGCGQTVTASLSPSSGCIIDTFPTAVYSFQGTAGQTLQLIAGTASGNVVSLELTDAAGKWLWNDLDEPAQITYTFTANGTYFINVSFGNPHASGTFTLETSCVTTGTPPPATCNFTATVAIGDTISGQLDSSDATCGNSTTYAKAYKLPVNIDEAFTVTYSASYPVALEVFGPKSSTERSWVGKDSILSSVSTDYVAPNTGNVTIWVMSKTEAPVAGSFTLQIAPLATPSCGRRRAVRH